MATSLVPVLIGLSSFMASFLVPLVTRHLPLNRILWLTQLGKMLLLLVLTVLSRLEMAYLPFLYLFISLISVLDGFASPVSRAILPRYASDLGKANAALSMSSEGVQLVGWGLGGLLFAMLGWYPSLILVLALFMVSTVLMLSLPLVFVEEIPSETSWESLTKGWRLLFKKPQLRLLMGTNLLEILANSVWVSSVILVFVIQILHQTETFWGYGNSVYSFGILLGGLVVFRLSEAFLACKWQSILVALLSIAFLTLVTVQVPHPYVYLATSLLIGIFSQVKEVPESVLLQESVSKNDLVNVYASFEVLSTLAFSVFVVLVSYLTEQVGVIASFWLTIICLLFEAFLVFKNKEQLH